MSGLFPRVIERCCRDLKANQFEQTKWWFFLVDISSLDLNSAMIYAASRAFILSIFDQTMIIHLLFLASIQCEAIIDVPQ